MIRENLNADSKNVLMALSPNNGYLSQSRSSTGGSTTGTTGLAGSAPAWVKLNRTGNVFTTSRSPDGTNWTVTATYTIPMAANIYIGLVSSAYHDGVLCTATFDKITVVP